MSWRLDVATPLTIIYCDQTKTSLFILSLAHDMLARDLLS